MVVFACVRVCDGIKDGARNGIKPGGEGNARREHGERRAIPSPVTATLSSSS